jgi:hypothetical protein
MKVLTHQGAVLTFPFTSTNSNDTDFDRLDGAGVAKVGIVAEHDQGTVDLAARRAAKLGQSLGTAREITNDLRFIARQLMDVAEGAEIRMESKGTKFRLLIPDEARAKPQQIKPGDRVAINWHVTRKELVNAHGTVESMSGGQAFVKLDAGDRRRAIGVTGNDLPESLRAPIGILDKAPGEK